LELLVGAKIPRRKGHASGTHRDRISPLRSNEPPSSPAAADFFKIGGSDRALVRVRASMASPQVRGTRSAAGEVMRPTLLVQWLLPHCVMSGDKREVVVITGASAGVGRATARAFARRGARLGLIARGRDGLWGACRDVRDLGGEAIVLPCDVADAAALEEAASMVERQLGPIDIWVNNAMTTVFSPVKQTKPEEYRRVTEVTYLGAVYGTLAALHRMLPRDRGVIVQVGSALAYRAIPLQTSYCAAKHAIRGFTEGLRCELLHDGSKVRVTMVQMPALNTPQFDWMKSRLPRKGQPVPPIYQPEVAARAIVWAAHHDRRELYVGWPAVKTIVGNKIAPGLADRYLARTGYQSQQTDEPADPNRPHNLWEPVPGDRGAHGRFDARAGRSSLQLRAATRRRWVAAAALAAFALTIAAKAVE
jgi:NAD(P)-dependent dehydrogenase (short-subunit alcohol dehydrogenase family)